MAWCHQTPSYYLKHCWQKSMTPYIWHHQSTKELVWTQGIISKFQSKDIISKFHQAMFTFQFEHKDIINEFQTKISSANFIKLCLLFSLNTKILSTNFKQRYHQQISSNYVYFSVWTQRYYQRISNKDIISKFHQTTFTFQVSSTYSRTTDQAWYSYVFRWVEIYHPVGCLWI